MLLVSSILPFIRSIGIEVIEGPIADSCFLPGLRIDRGRLLVDVERLLYPGDLLHEAGHIALVPPAERHTLMDETIGQREHAPAEEMAAIAWSWAAALHLNIDPAIVFHDFGYQGGGAFIVENFSKEQYFGVPYLAYLGLCQNLHTADKNGGPPSFPHMLRWTID